ncbi:hypothetical protein M569_04163, partial [Genlisea aurea]
SALQKHVLFFDRDGDGIIYPSETFRGFRAIGSGVLLSSVAAAFIHLALSRKTRPGKGFSPSFPIEVSNITMGKHSSDSGVYDEHGRQKFEEIFARHARTHRDALTGSEVEGFMKSNREPSDYGGWVAALAEWKILYLLCKDENGLLHKHKVRGALDGTLFQEMEKEVSAKK